MASKFSPAHSSGMRGSEKPTMAAEEAEGMAGRADNEEGESTEDQDFDVNEHVHGPDENGHHHLNLSTLAEAMQKKGGIHEQ